MRNRGYKYVIKKNSMGYMLLCINATWINQMLRDRGIRPKDFRKLTWKDIAGAQTSEGRKRLFEELKPASFWQMCDTLALSYAEYDVDPGEKLYQQDWFVRNPVYTLEDIYEILLEKNVWQEDALRIMEFARRGKCCMLRLSQDEFLQLYDVPEGIQEIIKKSKYIPHREKVIQVLLDIIERAVYASKRKEEIKNRESI